MSEHCDGRPGGESRSWEGTERRGRVLVEEARCRVAAGGRLDARWLDSATRWLAEVAPAWEDMAGERPAERAYRPICASVHLEAWLIAWPAGGRLQLHDHGGAGGALRVVRGELCEEFAVAGAERAGGTRTLRTPLRRRCLDMTTGCAFAAAPDGGSQYVHDVVNPVGSLATSVHLYGPASRPMAFFRHDGAVLSPVPALDAASVVEPGAAAGVPAR